MIKPKNLARALREQLPISRLYRNFCVTGNGWGMFHINSHQRYDTGKLKVMYNTPQTANKAAVSIPEAWKAIYLL